MPPGLLATKRRAVKVHRGPARPVWPLESKVHRRRRRRSKKRVLGNESPSDPRVIFYEGVLFFSSGSFCST